MEIRAKPLSQNLLFKPKKFRELHFKQQTLAESPTKERLISTAFNESVNDSLKGIQAIPSEVEDEVLFPKGLMLI